MTTFQRRAGPIPVLCLFGFLAEAGVAHADVGDLPVINTVQAQGVFGMPFNQAATGEQIAIFIINCNTTTAFDLDFHFTNLGKFKSGTREIAMSNIKLNGVSGTLGAGLTVPSNTAVTLDGSGNWTWNPGATQTTETVNYLVELKANWPDGSSNLAGFYSESITVTISIGL